MQGPLRETLMEQEQDTDLSGMQGPLRETLMEQES